MPASPAEQSRAGLSWAELSGGWPIRAWVGSGLRAKSWRGFVGAHRAPTYGIPPPSIHKALSAVACKEEKGKEGKGEKGQRKPIIFKSGKTEGQKKEEEKRGQPEKRRKKEKSGTQGEQ